MNFYNEIDTYACNWLDNLIEAGEIPAGHVDRRSIVDLQPEHLNEYTQAHFFAGIAGWPLALRLAGWPEDEPVWTGSCPCQPLSSAGKRKGSADERHLWPEFFRLIEQCRPGTVFGEQVGGHLGEEWLSAVRVDLESIGYAVGAVDLPAASVGAPHIRQRLYWVAHAGRGRVRGDGPSMAGASSEDGGETGEQRVRSDPGHGGAVVRLAHADTSLRNAGGRGIGRGKGRLDVLDPDGEKATDQVGGSGSMADTASINRRPGAGGENWQETGDCGAWSDIRWVWCKDEKYRPIKPGLEPVVDGVPGRLGRIRAFGNAIVPQVAAAFIQAFMESTE